MSEVNICNIPGVSGNNQDIWTPLQGYVDSLPAGSSQSFFVPKGLYNVSKPFTLTRLGNWRIRGEGSENSKFIMEGKNLGPTVMTEGNIFHAEDIGFIGNLTAPRQVIISDSKSWNGSIEDPNKAGVGFWSNNTQGGSFLRTKFAGQIGCLMYDPFMTNWNHCQWNGQNGSGPGTFAGSLVGLCIHQATDCSIIGSCDTTGWLEGIRINGANVGVHDMRFEVNNKGMRLGCDPAGFPRVLASSTISGCTMEANDYGLYCNVMSVCTLQSLSINGTPGSPSQGGICGINLQTLSNVIIQAFSIQGWHKQSGLYLRPTNTENKRIVMQAGFIQNGQPGGKTWDLPKMEESDLTMIACNI